MALNKKQLLEDFKTMSLADAEYHLENLNNEEYQMSLHGKAAKDHLDYWMACVRRLEQLNPDNHRQNHNHQYQDSLLEQQLKDPNNTLSRKEIEFHQEMDREQRAISNHNGPGLCTRCGGPTTLSMGKHGKYYRCDNYNRCGGSRNFIE